MYQAEHNLLILQFEFRTKLLKLLKKKSIFPDFSFSLLSSVSLMIWTNKIAIENNVVTVNTTLKRFRKNPPVFSKFCEDTQPICEEARKGENRLLDSELAEYLDLFSKTDLNKQLTESLEEQLSDTSSETASNPSPKPKEECVRVTKIEGHRKTDGTSTFKENDVKVSNVMGAMPEKKIFKDMLFILSFPTLNPKSGKLFILRIPCGFLIFL